MNSRFSLRNVCQALESMTEKLDKRLSAEYVKTLNVSEPEARRLVRIDSQRVAQTRSKDEWLKLLG